MEKKDIYNQEILRTWFNSRLLLDILNIILSLFAIIGLCFYKELVISQCAIIALFINISLNLRIINLGCDYVSQIWLEKDDLAKKIDKNLKILAFLTTVLFSVSTMILLLNILIN